MFLVFLNIRSDYYFNFSMNELIIQSKKIVVAPNLKHSYFTSRSVKKMHLDQYLVTIARIEGKYGGETF